MAGKHRLSAAFVKSTPVGKHRDGSDLWLVQRPDGGAQWSLRVVLRGRRRETGLGSLADGCLKVARDMAERRRAVAASVRDATKAARNDNALRKVAEEAIEARKTELKGDGKAGR